MASLQSFLGENFASPLGMQIECLCSGNIPVFSYTQYFMPRSIEIEGNAIRIGTDHDVGRSFENSREPDLRRLRSFTFADLALEREPLVSCNSCCAVCNALS